MATFLRPQSRGVQALRQQVRKTFAIAAAFLALVAWTPQLNAQQTGTVTGRVTDASTAQPLASAQISIPELSLGVLTQQNGRFILLNVPAGTHTINVQRIGFRAGSATITVAAGGSVTQDFAIDQEALSLDEIIVTGTPGGSQRRAIGNSVERVSAAEITEQAVITDMQDLLAARTPGLRFGRSDGQIGGGSGITIRGVSSVSLGSQPLIYVDGIRVDNDATKGPATGSANGNASALNDLNPEEIESIEVIKGPAAATLYGTEASAGVIQIITKKGAVGAPEFTFEVAQGTNFMVDPAGTLGTQYVCKVSASPCDPADVVEVNMYNEANDYFRHTGRFEGIDLPFPARDEDLFGYGYSQGYNLSVRGGSDQVRYYLAGSWDDGTGVLDYNTNQSTNLRANVTVVLPGDLNIDVSTGYGQGDTRFATVDEEGGVWHQLVWGSLAELPGIRTPGGQDQFGFQERFPEDLEATDVSRDWSRFTGSVQATQTPLEWLTHRLTFGVDRGWETNKQYLPPEQHFPNAPQGALIYGRPIEQNVTFDYSASARFQVSESLGTNTSFGAQYYSNFTENLTNSGLGFPTKVQTVIDQTEFGNRQVDFNSVENKSAGFYIQEELSWQDRVYLTAAMRADDNSAFGSEFDLQYYPKLSASYVISEEPFFSNVALIDNLRLRGAWGQSGRQPGTFASQTLYGTFLGPNGNGLLPTTAGNPEIGPEVSTELELGFDVALLDQRVSGEFSWYTTKTEDLLVDQSLAPSTGLTGSRDANLGTMKNWGWEASVDARLVERSNFAFDLNLAGDYTKNEITSLGQDIVPSGNFQIGWPYPNVATSYYLREAAFSRPGVVDRASVMCDGGVPAVPGGPNIMPGGETIPCSQYTDDGILLGPTYPNYSFHVSPTVTLMNNLQVFALAEGQYGRWIASTDANYACRYYRTCRVGVVRDDPFFVAGTSSGSIDDRYNGRFLADFWKLRQVGVRLSIPSSLASRFGADRASLSFSGNNLATLWQRNDTDLAGANIFDPEYSINGSDPQATALWEMPGIASVNAALRVTF